MLKKKKHAVEAVKSNCLSSRHVEINLQRIRSKRCCLED